MAVAQQAPASNAPFLKGSIIWEKKGPLPVWAWALLVLGLVLAVTMWRRNSASATATEATTGGDVPPNQAAPPVFIVPQGPPPNVTITVPGAPPGAGRPHPPLTPRPPSNFRDTGAIWTDALELHWDQVPGASGYAIRDLGSGQVHSVVGGNTTGTMLRGLIHNGSYNLQIAAKNLAGGLGPWSATLNAKTKN